MKAILYRGGAIAAVRGVAEPLPDALLIEDGAVSWLGSSSDIPQLLQSREQESAGALPVDVVELDGELITPAFVDSHIDLVALGQQVLDDLDLPRRDYVIAGLERAAQSGFAAVDHYGSLDETLQGLTHLVDSNEADHPVLPWVNLFPPVELITADQGASLASTFPEVWGFAAASAIDGTFSSREAAVKERYSDLSPPQWSGDDEGLGVLHMSAAAIAHHLVIATQLQRPASFDIHGDRALEEFIAGVELAVEHAGLENFRAVGHRIVGSELLDASALASLVLFGIGLIAQPQYHSEFGGDDGLYAQRLGHLRSVSMSPWADIAAAGVHLQFSSYGSEVPLDPWATIYAAMNHYDRSQRLAPVMALAAHTGGWPSIEVGMPANIAMWDLGEGGTTDYSFTPTRSRKLNDLVIRLPSMVSKLGDTYVAPRCTNIVRDGRQMVAAREALSDTPELSDTR